MKKLTVLLLSLFLLTGALLNTACDWKKAERPLTAAGYNFQIGILAAAKTSKAAHDCGNGFTDAAKYKAFLTALQKTSTIGQAFSAQIDKTIEINPQTKVELLAAADNYLAEIDKTVALIDAANVKVREALLIVRSTAAAFKIAIAAITIPQTPSAVKANLKDAKSKAIAAGTRDVNQTVCLIDALGVISADFAADVLAQKGLDAAALRSQRDVKFNAVQSLISAELNK